MVWDFHDILVRLLNLFLVIVSFFLVLRFIFRLLSANPSTPFVSWIYDVSGTLISPFRGIFVNPIVSSINGQAIFDIVSVIALIFYALLVYFLISLVDAVTPDVEHEDHRSRR